jgi:hypothetical protein
VTPDELLADALEKMDATTRLATRWDTAGPTPPPEVEAVIPPPHSKWKDGWWENAIKRAAHPGRVGGPIVAFAEVAHSTDMVPESFDALVRSTTTTPGEGNCFHFLFGRTPAQGVIQSVSILRNANHAGGKGHGVFFDASGKTYHPNLVSIGVEFHCAGGVRRIGGQWRFFEDGAVHGKPLPDAEVTQDPKRPDRGWHNLTDYQREQWVKLTADLEPVLAPIPKGLGSKSLVEAAPTWAVMPLGQRVAGHVSLDAARRADPWPPTMAWLRSLHA